MIKPKMRYLALFVFLASLFGSAGVLAGSNSTSLPNGANLSVSIDSPQSSTEFLVPGGSSAIDVNASGTASIGVGEPSAVFAYVVDGSGSTGSGGGTGCSPVLSCEKQFFEGLNNGAIADGSVAEVGVVVFGAGAVAADMSPSSGDQLLTSPAADVDTNGVRDVSTVINSATTNGGVGQFTARSSGGGSTNFTAGLQSVLTVLNGTSVTNPSLNVVFASDGASNSGGGGFGAAVSALANAGVTVNTIAVGSGTSCTSGSAGTLKQIADGTGGTCYQVSDPGNLPDLITNLIGSTLTSLQISVDGGAATSIPNTDITPNLPQPGAASVSYDTVVPGLGVGDHEVCVTANGVDASGNAGSVTQCETIHLYGFTLTPESATNELSAANSHAMTAILSGDHDLAGRNVSFTVSGQNAGATGTCNPNADCTTDSTGQVSFTYSVPIAPSSLGSDTITASLTLADPSGETAIATATKEWIDTTPPVSACVESVNPHGQTTPPAGSTTLPGAKGGQNEDGFYQLLATDDVWPASSLEIFVTDTGSGTVFGPYAVGTVIKYTQDPSAVPEAKSIGSGNGQAGAVEAHVIGNGDAAIYSFDGSGNTSAPVPCLVPPPPK